MEASTVSRPKLFIERNEIAKLLRQMRNKIAHGDFTGLENKIEEYAQKVMDGRYSFDYSEYSRKNWVLLNACCLLEDTVRNIIIMLFTDKEKLKSIKEHGLSAIDIRKALPDLSVAMNEIIDTVDRKYSELGIDWGENAGFPGNCKRMANREYKNQSGMDYEYGSVYVTLSQSRILIYYSYEFGSELITYFYRLYRCLFVKLKDNSRDAFDAKYRKLVDVINIENFE